MFIVFSFLVFLFLSSCNETTNSDLIGRLIERVNNLEQKVNNHDIELRNLDRKTELLHAKTENLDKTYITKNDLDTKIGSKLEKIDKILLKLSTTTKKNSVNINKNSTISVDRAYKKARSLHQKGKYREALVIYKKLEGTKLKWYDKRVRFFKAKALYDQKKYKNSIVSAQHFIDKYPHANYTPSAILLQIKGLLKLKRKRDAQLIYKELKAKFPSAKQTKEAKKLLRGN